MKSKFTRSDEQYLKEMGSSMPETPFDAQAALAMIGTHRRAELKFRNKLIEETRDLLELNTLCTEIAITARWWKRFGIAMLWLNAGMAVAALVAAFSFAGWK